MAPSMDDVMEVCQILSRQQDLKVTVNQAFKGGLWALGGAFVGGLLGGRLGVALGGAAGSLAGATAVDDFRPVADVLGELREEQKEQLYNSAMKVISSFDAADGVNLALLLSSNQFFEAKLLNALKGFISQNLNMAMG